MSDLGRRCTAHSSRTGQPCNKPAIKGGTVCNTHGGRAPQVRAKANRRLLAAVEPILEQLVTLATTSDNPKVKLAAIKDALDRAGIGEPVQALVRTSHKQPVTGAAAGLTVKLINYIPSQPMDPRTLDVTAETAPVMPAVMPPQPLVALPGENLGDAGSAPLDADFRHKVSAT